MGVGVGRIGGVHGVSGLSGTHIVVGRLGLTVVGGWLVLMRGRGTATWAKAKDVAETSAAAVTTIRTARSRLIQRIPVLASKNQSETMRQVTWRRNARLTRDADDSAESSMSRRKGTAHRAAEAAEQGAPDSPRLCGSVCGLSV
jgi:hypothetical protein